MYKLNNIELINYGIHAGRAPNSNIALSGFLDMPARLGKTHHDWAEDEGTEPYVLEEEIMHGGRNITFYGLLRGDNKADAINRVQDLYAHINQFTDLVPLETPWGTFSVYIKDMVDGEYLGHGWATLEITFREPVVAMTETLPTGTSMDIYAIDNIPYTAFGAIVTHIEGDFNRSVTKGPHFRVYGKEGYQVTKMAPIEVKQTFYFSAKTYTELKSNVEKLQQLLASSGLRFINIDHMDRSCFNVDGFEVNDIRIMPGLCICRLNLSMVMVGTGVAIAPAYLLDNSGDYILSESGFIRI